MYLVRRYLFFDWDTWERLPGYQQKAYLEQLRKAKPWTTDGGEDPNAPSGGGQASGGARSMDVDQPMSGVFGRR